MKKLIIYTVFFLFLSLIASAQTPNWQWAKSGKGSIQDYGSSICTDADGNCFATGYFNSPSIIFDNDTLINTTASDHFYLVKYDNSSNLLWAKTADCPTSSYGTCVKTDRNGNCYMTGYWGNTPTIIFDSDTLTDTTSNNNHIFIVKYNSTGNVLWAKFACGELLYDPNSMMFKCLGIDADCNVYLSGFFGSFNGGSINFDDTTLLNTGYMEDIFIAKYDSSGNFLWAKKAGGDSKDICTGLIADENGNSYITGYFNSDTMYFDSIKIFRDNGKIFIAKYDNSGNVLWARSCGNYASFHNMSIGIDGNRNSYVSGFAYSDNYVGFDSIVYTVSGGADIFLLKFDNSGNLVWAKTAGGQSADEAYGMCTDENGNSYITGMFHSMIIFGSTSLISSGANEIFVAKYDSSGNALRAQKAGGNNVDVGTAISIDVFGNSYVTGYFFSPYIYFGNITLTNCDTISTPAEVFVAKLGAIVGISEVGNDLVNEINIFPNPSIGEFRIADSKNKIENIIIYNTMGTKVYETKVEAYEKTVNLYLPDGVYFVQVNCEEGIIGKKIIIQK